MQCESDARLLREYAEQGRESAFGELVARHTNIVYSAALRQVDSPDLAAEVAQQAFVGLARGAQVLCRKLAEDASLAGWLCRSALNLSLNLRRDEFRRRSRERQAMADHDPTPESTPDWDRVRPVLDEAMAELGEIDYEAVVMRFYQNQDLCSVGRALGLSEDAAQKRVSRALDKLREGLLRRGLRASAAALSVALSTNAVQAAPVSLTATISAAVAAGGAGLAASAAVSGSKAMGMGVFQKALLAAVVVGAVAIPLVTQQRKLARLRAEQSALLSERRVAGSQAARAVFADDGANRSRREREELERLRRESAALRGRISEVSTRGQQLAAGTASRETTGGGAGEILQMAQVHDAGQATPAALLQTHAWAMLYGDTNRLAQLMAFSPGADTAKVQGMLEAVSTEATIGVMALLANLPFSEIRILREEPAEDNDRWVVHEFVAQDGKVLRRAKVRVRSTAAGWKVVVGTNGQVQEEGVDK